ncbi:MAG: acyl-CoA thioesterase domain-containing protein, partial [Paracoccaceae bacterium]
MQQILKQLPYARFLGLEGQDGGVIKLPYRGFLIGNPILPALHGGVTASVLQIAAQIHVMDALSIPLTTPPKLIDFTVDYLRRSLPEDGFAKAQMTRAGR